MRIGLLGGTFDPIHNGHIKIAQYAYDKLNLDAVWFIINNIPPHKQKESNSTSEDRLNMLNIALQDYPYFHICDIELKRKGKSYTYDTIKAIKENNPNDDFYFIIGGDNVDILDSWFKIDELVKMVKFVAFKRRGSFLKTKYPITIMDMDLFNVSSTEIRNNEINHLNPLVLDYIIRAGLYGYSSSNRNSRERI